MSTSATVAAAEIPTLATHLMDRALDLLREKRFFVAFQILGSELSEIRDAAVSVNAVEQFVAAVRSHEAFSFCQEDPYTRRAYRKPRGYAGDAVMLDYVYIGAPPEDTSEVGIGIFGATTRTAMGLSVLFRRSLLRSYIDDTVSSHSACRILSVASGHCRELESSLFSADISECEFIALDQDPKTSKVVPATYDHPRLSTVTRRINTLILSTSDFGTFDLIYSAGLYDYLPDAVATALTARLMEMLRPGGRLVVANFLPRC